MKTIDCLFLKFVFCERQTFSISHTEVGKKTGMKEKHTKAEKKHLARRIIFIFLNFTRIFAAVLIIPNAPAEHLRTLFAKRLIVFFLPFPRRYCYISV